MNFLEHLQNDNREPIEPSPEKKKELEALFKSMIDSLPKTFDGPRPRMWFTGSQEDWDKMSPETKAMFENDNPTN